MAAWLSRLTLLRTLVTHVRLATRLVREPRVSLVRKGLLVVGALYVISPIDLIPDFLLGLGEIDDLGVLLLALELFLAICPAAAVTFHRAAIDEGRRYSPMSPLANVIDAEWRRD